MHALRRSDIPAPSLKKLKGAVSVLALSAALGLALPAMAQQHQPQMATSTLTPTAAADIVRDPADLPPPITRHAPATVRIDLQTVELEGRLDDGTTYKYWTFNGKVPGPLFRVRVGAGASGFLGTARLLQRVRW